MNAQTDQQLLRAYAERDSEAAFAELVRRHIDLVYSAARRMVGDRHHAEDVTQGVFVALAQNACQLTPHPVLSGWLHRTTHNLAANAVRTIVRRQMREQEAVVMNELLAAEPDADWENIAPHLDAGLGELSAPDRDALLLRYFERKSASEMATTLGISDQAAQKRVSRAVERLREFFTKRGITVSASGLVVVISVNAVQAAPVGLALTISTAAAFAGAVCAPTAPTISTFGILQSMASTKIKLGLSALVAAGVITPMLMQRQLVSRLRTENEYLRLQLATRSIPPVVTHPVTNSDTDELARLRSEHLELMRNRGEVTRLRQQLAATTQNPAASTTAPPGFYDFHPVAKWTNAGLGDPAAAHQTRLWAESNQDRETFFRSIAAAEGPGASPETMEVVAKMLTLKPWAEVATGFRLIAVNPLSEDLVEVQTQTEWQSGKKDIGMEVLKRVGNEWKALVFSFKIDDDHSTWAFVHAGQLNAAGEFVNTILLPDESK